jgi:toxin ParE1/3/4
MTYRLSRQADEDYIEIYMQGVERFGILQAEQYLDRLEWTFRFLSDVPQAARERPELSPPMRVYPYGSHIIIYRIDPSGDVFIVRIRHRREDWLTDHL